MYTIVISPAVRRKLAEVQKLGARLDCREETRGARLQREISNVYTEIDRKFPIQ